MRIWMVGVVVVGVLLLGSCASGVNASRPLSSKALYGMFDDAGSLALRTIRESNVKGCRYQHALAAPRVKHEWLTFALVDDIHAAKESSAPLEKICIALREYSSSVDSLIEQIEPAFAEHLQVSPTLSNVVRSGGPFTPGDTTLILSELTRVMLRATSTLLGNPWYCGFGDDVPYVAVSPVPRADSFSVRVGLRMPRLCVDSTNYAIVFGDTIPYTSNAWADGNFHRKLLSGVDTLWVKSCMGNPLLGIHWCVDTWEVVGW